MTKPAERSAARLAAVQALYQMDVSGKGVDRRPCRVRGLLDRPRGRGHRLRAVRRRVFPRHPRRASSRTSASIDQAVDAALAAGWPLTRIEAVLRAILRAGAYELMLRKDVPARVVISEYVDVTHGFYGDDEPGLVNAVLDRLAREARPGELDKKPAGRA